MEMGTATETAAGTQPNLITTPAKISRGSHRFSHSSPSAQNQGAELDKSTLLAAPLAPKKGDFSVRLPVDLAGMDGKIADAFNDAIELNQRLSEELDRLGRVVGKEGNSQAAPRWDR